MHIKLLLYFIFCVPFVVFGSDSSSEYLVAEARYTYEPLGDNELEPLTLWLSRNKLTVRNATNVAIELDGSLLGVSFNLSAPPHVSFEADGKVSLLSTSIKGHKLGGNDFSPVSVWLYSFVNEGLHYVSIRPLYAASSEVTWVDLVTRKKSTLIPSQLKVFLETRRSKKLEKQKPVDPFKNLDS